MDSVYVYTHNDKRNLHGLFKVTDAYTLNNISEMMREKSHGYYTDKLATSYGEVTYRNRLSKLAITNDLE